MDNETKDALRNHCNVNRLKPIHKFNNARGATLCHDCGIVITEGLTEETLCMDCKQEFLKGLLELIHNWSQDCNTIHEPKHWKEIEKHIYGNRT